ncbi:MAG: hypothetical protein ACK499_07965 [Betaproteobacteria bacterium]|jgi:hypothetical protein|nr:hypothetical protein AEM42_11140 [Betaproteobacteria bacterium UKL13-2]HCG53381.1 hypothetical protein [Betaproteobacteria bacterium]
MKTIKLKDVPLQSLKIPTGWTVTWNQFYDIEPNSNIYLDGLPDGDVWELFLQDLLQLKHFNKNIILDLGWTPEANPEGSYLLQVIADEDWSTPIVVYKSKNKSEVVGKIDDLLLKIASGDIEV